ncbi:MAG: type II secretion system protein [Candidatus Buchananbacteria bacterium]|nr:type II secretion system protein [Candidatus Buchananbacteria bacterium]
MKKSQKQSGFTLIELILYLAIVSIILVSISYLMLDMLSGQTKNYTSQDINQQLRFISNIITKDIRAAQDITSISDDNLVLTMPGDDITLHFDTANSTLTRQVGFSNLIILHDTSVKVTGVFADQSYDARTKNVAVTLRLEYDNPSNQPEYAASTTAIFSAELRGRK